MELPGQRGCTSGRDVSAFLFLPCYTARVTSATRFAGGCLLLLDSERRQRGDEELPPSSAAAAAGRNGDACSRLEVCRAKKRLPPHRRARCLEPTARRGSGWERRKRRRRRSDRHTPVSLTSPLRAASGPRNAWRHLGTDPRTSLPLNFPSPASSALAAFVPRSDEGGKAPRGTCVIAGEASDAGDKRVPVSPPLIFLSCSLSAVKAPALRKARQKELHLVSFVS